MSGIIGGAGSKSGVINPEAGVHRSITTYATSYTSPPSGGDITGWALNTDGQASNVGANWSISGAELTPPYLGHWMVHCYTSFYSSGDNNNDNLEGYLSLYAGSWGTCAEVRVGHQYNGTYTRGGGSHSTVIDCNASTNKIKYTISAHTDGCPTKNLLTLIYLGST